MDEEKAFLKRLATFDAVKWHGSCKEASPFVCAQHGWINVGFRILKCETCGVVFPFSLSRKDAQSEAQEVKKTLMEKHSEHCIWRTRDSPFGLLGLNLEPLESVSQSLLHRFDSYRLLWDLPETESAVQETASKDDWQLLFGFLHRRLRTSLTTAEADRYSTALEKRVRSIMMLALLGWRLKWIDHPIYPEHSNDSPFHFTQGSENIPTESGICFGRQSYIVCELCNAKVGLWSVETVADLGMDAFKEVAKKLNNIKETPAIGMKRRREEDFKEKTAEVLRPSPDRPAFGIRSFKKRSSVILPASLEKTMKMEKEGLMRRAKADARCRPVIGEKRLNPIESHRHFCPYRSQWIDVLKALTRG